MSRAARLVGDRWTLLIVRALMDGERRFNEMQELLGNVSSGTLSGRLKQLEKNDMISRHAFAETPPRVEYRLTEMGRSLLDPLAALVRWADAYYGAIRGARSEYDQQQAA